MSTYDFPVSANRIVELPMVFKYFDKRYGTPDISEPKKKNGEYALRVILKYLSYHKRSTCDEIAQDEYNRNLSSRRKLKSITDDIRKFLKNNLIVSELVFHDEPKKKYNKQVETYSLSPIGILYSMYLLGNFRKTNDFGMDGYDLLKIDRNLIRSLGKEYSETLPKVFGRFELFEKILGKDFVDIMIAPFIAIYDLERPEVPITKLLLTDHVLTSYEFLYPHRFNTIMGVHKFIAEQISLIFYIHLEDSILKNIQDQNDDFEKLLTMDDDESKKYYENRSKNGTARYRESLNQARNKWIQIMDEDKELKKWFNNFLKDATTAKTNECGAVSQYLKEVYSPWDFKKFGIN